MPEDDQQNANDPTRTPGVLSAAERARLAGLQGWQEPPLEVGERVRLRDGRTAIVDAVYYKIIPDQIRGPHEAEGMLVEKHMVTRE